MSLFRCSIRFFAVASQFRSRVGSGRKLPKMLLLCLLGASALLLHAEGRRAEMTITNNNNGHSLDNDKWLSTVSQYDKDRYWNKFRDVSSNILFSCAHTHTHTHAHTGT
ncbi:hypothetical protein COCON_G00054510, partial [Conger conger]